MSMVTLFVSQYVVTGWLGLRNGQRVQWYYALC